MTVLIVVNDAPYETERAYNALRIATALTNGAEPPTVRLFLIGEGVWCAAPPPQPADASYDIAWMMARFNTAGRRTAACRTCLDQRGIRTESLLDGCYVSTLEELTRWIAEADRVLTF